MKLELYEVRSYTTEGSYSTLLLSEQSARRYADKYGEYKGILTRKLSCTDTCIPIEIFEGDKTKVIGFYYGKSKATGEDMFDIREWELLEYIKRDEEICLKVT